MKAVQILEDGSPDCSIGCGDLPQFYKLDAKLTELVSTFLIQNNIVPPDSFVKKYGLNLKTSKVQSNPVSLKNIEMYIESSVSDTEKGANGIVFTPNYIIDYILKTINIHDLNSKIIDPSCGCGSFLVKAAEHVANKFQKSLCDVIEENLFGIDIVPEFVESSKLILSLLCLQNGEDPSELKFNILCKNSLDEDWTDNFNVDHFDYVIGNPPYSNPHDLDESIIKLIKTKYQTTKKGTSNIFYAFIEKGMTQLGTSGQLGFIIPNNYLSITAAQPLRKILKQSSMISKIVDFGDNMVFAPTRTYNSLLFLDTKCNDIFEYSVIPTTKNIEKDLNSAIFQKYNLEDLEDEGWKLLPPDQLEIIRNLERFDKTIKKYIHTGIATLRDDVYLMDGFDENKGLYFKDVDGVKFYVESGIVRKLFKISDLSSDKPISDSVRFIICPYRTSFQKKIDGGKQRTSSLMSELELSSEFPLCYEYLKYMRPELDKREKGKGATPLWFAYGRTQSLNYIGRKLLFPTFSAKPKFMMLDDEEALFCNGYAVVEDSDIEIEILQTILNSSLMEYYVSNTSYPIEGGYYCYQKKFIQKFSIPEFSEDEIHLMKTGDMDSIETMLSQKYSVPRVR